MPYKHEFPNRSDLHIVVIRNSVNVPSGPRVALILDFHERPEREP